MDVGRCEIFSTILKIVNAIAFAIGWWWSAVLAVVVVGRELVILWRKRPFGYRWDIRRLPLIRRFFPVVFAFDYYLGLGGAANEQTKVSSFQAKAISYSAASLSPLAISICSNVTGQKVDCLIWVSGEPIPFCKLEYIPAGVFILEAPLNEGPRGADEGRPTKEAFMATWGDFTFEFVCDSFTYRKRFRQERNKSLFRRFAKESDRMEKRSKMFV